MITSEETEREKARLPRGWGRFGKAIDELVAVSEPDEVLLSCCIGKRELTLRWPENELHVKGIAKQMLPRFVDALTR